MKIVMVGTGYVGLVTGACLAEKGGHSVCCLDIDQEKIAKLTRGHLPIYEPGLQEIVERNVRLGRLQFTSDYSCVASANACFIAVPTPSNQDGSCNISYVEDAARQIAEHLTGYSLLVNKSTVPVGAADRVRAIVTEVLKHRGLKIDFDVVSNPEFLKEGAAIQDCLFPDRIIIGSDGDLPASIMKEIYALFLPSGEEDRMILMDTRSAEMTKYAANAMLATRISFMNEIANICKKVGANVNVIRKGMGTDPRIGPNFLYPGVGYGGSCFPKDIRALMAIAKNAGAESTILQAADAVNERQKKVLAQQMTHYFSSRGGLLGKTIAIWGLAFKPDTDDMREAPSLTVIDHLLKQGVRLRLFDPVAMANAKKILGEPSGIVWCESESDAAAGADAIALITEWKQFRHVDLTSIANSMSGLALFDGRNQYKPEEMKKLGFDYISIGAPDQIHAIA
jgi:UDPglucose 6-dehydrogenase